MFQKLILTFNFLAIFIFSSKAQVSINTNNSPANNSAMLDVSSSDKGMLIPRMSSTQRFEIANPSNGLMVYDNNSETIWVWNQSVSLWEEISSGPNHNLQKLTTDTFQINNLPSFSADLASSQTFTTPNGYFEIGNWRTNDGAIPYMHDNGDHFDEATGRFSAPFDGFYMFSAQIRFDNIELDPYRLLLAVNGLTSINNGFHALSHGQTNIIYNTLSVSGVMKLNSGDVVSLVATAGTDASWVVHSESGFSGYLISTY